MCNQPPKPEPLSWESFFALDAITEVPADFLDDADRQPPNGWPSLRSMSDLDSVPDVEAKKKG